MGAIFDPMIPDDVVARCGEAKFSSQHRGRWPETRRALEEFLRVIAERDHSLCGRVVDLLHDERPEVLK